MFKQFTLLMCLFAVWPSAATAHETATDSLANGGGYGGVFGSYNGRSAASFGYDHYLHQVCPPCNCNPPPPPPPPPPSPTHPPSHPYEYSSIYSTLPPPYSFSGRYGGFYGKK